MKKRTVFSDQLVLIAVLIFCLVRLLTAFAVPGTSVGQMDVLTVLALCLAAQAVKVLALSKEKFFSVPAILSAAISFGLLPWCVGISTVLAPWWMALVGAAAFCAAEALASISKERIVGKCSKLAALLNLGLLYLAAQGLQAMF